MFAQGTLLVVSCLFLIWGTAPSQAEDITCEELWGRFAEHNCDASDLTERCQRIYRRLGINECLDGDEQTTTQPTTEETTVAPIQYCTSLSPGRYCASPEGCESFEGSRVLDLVCGDSPDGYVCCQQQTEAPDCPVGASGGQVTQCLARSDCFARSGAKLDTQSWCGDGPELCCTYNEA